MYQALQICRKTLDDAVAAIGMTQQALGDVMVGDVMVGAGSAVGGGRRNAGPILAEAAGKLLNAGRPASQCWNYPAGIRIRRKASVAAGWARALQPLNDSLAALKA